MGPDTLTVPSSVTTVPTVETVTRETVPDITVVLAPPGIIHTGSPVTPDRPEPVVVGKMPEIPIDPPGTTETRTVPRTVEIEATFWIVPVTGTVPEIFMLPVTTETCSVPDTTVVFAPPGISHTGSPVIPLNPEPVVVGVIPDI